MHHTRHLIAISHYVTDYFASQLRPDVQVHYVPNAIDESFFNPVSSPDGHTILFAGRVTPLKRVLDLIQAFAKIAQVPSAQLRIAGECSSERSYVESVRGFIQKANLEDQVHLLGALPEDAVLREFVGCDVLALPSAQENLSMVIAQAMAAGKPVVATPVGGIPEMVSDGETGFLVDVGDVDRLADALLRLLRDPSLRARMGQSGREFALENYGADTVARRTYNVYQKVAATGLSSESA
jgi:glycosyltransferase involved in cell wall biosynthesis